MSMYILVFILGAIFASFIHLYVTRTIKNESIIKPRSHCVNCNHKLEWFELIPILSYIICKGKCRKCGSKIGIDSLISELVLGLLFVIVYARYGISYETLMGMVISMALLSIAISDFKEMIILDSTIVTTGILTYLITFLEFGLRGVYKSFLYGVFGFVLFFLVKIFGDIVFKRESLGGGDIKLAFVMGSILPYNLFLVSIIAGSFAALPYAMYVSLSKKGRELAFGPFLVLGLLVVFLFKIDIMELLNMVVNIERVLL